MIRLVAFTPENKGWHVCSKSRAAGLTFRAHRFKEETGLEACLAHESHYIGDKWIDVPGLRPKNGFDSGSGLWSELWKSKSDSVLD